MSREIWSVNELAKYLKLSKRSCYELTKERVRARMQFPLPYVKLNRHKRFVSTDVEAWIEKLREEQAA